MRPPSTSRRLTFRGLTCDELGSCPQARERPTRGRSAWARRNCIQVGPSRRGAGPRPCRRGSVLIVVAPTRIPSLRSSPEIPTQPQRGFSLAIRSTSTATSSSIGGRPAYACSGRSICVAPASGVSAAASGGVTRNDIQRSAGSTRLAAASRARSPAVNLGRPLLRRNTRS